MLFMAVAQSSSDDAEYVVYFHFYGWRYFLIMGLMANGIGNISMSAMLEQVVKNC